MTTLKHPGIDMVENIRARGAMDDQQILNRMHLEKSALNLRMCETEPARLAQEDIQALRKYEVAISYLNIADPSNETALHKLRQAMKGYSPTDNPNDSLLYERKKDYALNDRSPKERVNIGVQYD